MNTNNGTKSVTWVRWNKILSRHVHCTVGSRPCAGVRQGGVLSPLCFFTVYCHQHITAKYNIGVNDTSRASRSKIWIGFENIINDALVLLQNHH